MIPIEKFQEQGGRLKTDDIDFDSFRAQPLDEHVLRCIGYMHDIEYHTVLYTRELADDAGLEGPAVHRLPDAVELRGVLAWPGARPGAGDARSPGARPAAEGDAQLEPRGLVYSPFVFWGLGHLIRRFPAVHMTWGAINEWTANAAYNRLAKIADHPTLAELLGQDHAPGGPPCRLLRLGGAGPAAGPPGTEDHQVVPAPSVGAGGQRRRAAHRDGVRHRLPVRQRRGTGISSIGSRSASTPCPGWPTSTWSARRSPRPPAR